MKRNTEKRKTVYEAAVVNLYVSPFVERQNSYLE